MKYDDEAERMVRVLYGHRLTKQELMDDLGLEQGQVGHLINSVRNRLGEELLLCEYDSGRHAFVYWIERNRRTAVDRYLVKRRRIVYTHIANIIRICDRALAKWPDEIALVRVRAMMRAAAELLDASTEPPRAA